ncbi:nuclear transport factor 2 family protein [Sporobolomyces koalae]|uniref:nuclear transport factor 2 family protein n=1 Tax=Sporobolomyces koalae TaxID=500713 RepID=UPI00317AE541
MAYAFSHPANIPQDKLGFISAFYRVSDSRDVDAYLDFLSSDVDFVMGINAVKGEAAVRKIRETMWGGVETRLHKPEKVYLGDDGEVMLHGTVSYGLKNGDRVENVGWAARMVFVQGGTEIKMSRYQVWLDGAPLANALRKQSEQSEQS